jgi:hypothetical protein
VTCNASAAGARLYLYGAWETREGIGEVDYNSAFGIGEATSADSLVVIGLIIRETFYQIPVDQHLYRRR